MTKTIPKSKRIAKPVVPTKVDGDSPVRWLPSFICLIGFPCFLFLMPLINVCLGVWLEGEPLHFALRAEQFEKYGLKQQAVADYEFALQHWKPRYNEKPPTHWQFNLARLHYQIGNSSRVEQLLERLKWDKQALNGPCIPILRKPSRSIRNPNHN